MPRRSSETRARALLAEHGIFICGFPDSRAEKHTHTTRGSSTAEHGPHKPDSRGSTPRPATSEHDETIAVPPQNESGARVAQSPVHPELLPGTDPTPESDLPPESDLTDDVMIAAGRLYADMQTQGAENISLQRYSWVLGLLTGTVSRLRAENAVMREMLQSALNIKAANQDE